MSSHFLSKYDLELKKISQILGMLLEYPESLSEFTFAVIPTLKSLLIYYEEYLDEIPHDDPEERLFFNPNWIPVAVDLRGFYVDPTDPKFSVFGTLRDDYPPFVWKKVILIDSLSDLVTLMPDRQAVEDLFVSHAVSCMDFLYEMRQRRVDLIYQGKSPAEPIEHNDVFPRKGEMPPSKSIQNGLQLTLTNVFPLAIGLLAHNSPISQLKLKWVDMPVREEDFSRLTCIRNLVTYLRNFDPGLLEFCSFRIEGLYTKVSYANYQVEIDFENEKSMLDYSKVFEEFSIC